MQGFFGHQDYEGFVEHQHGKQLKITWKPLGDYMEYIRVYRV